MSDHSEASDGEDYDESAASVASEAGEVNAVTDPPSASGVEKVAEFEEEVYVDVHSLPLRPPQPALPPEKAVRRPWHPVMWDSSIVGIPPPDHSEKDELAQPGEEYPHKQRIRNLKRLIAAGKVKPSKENLIFFLCNKFAISDERMGKISV